MVVREDGTLFGTNNDWLGFLGNIKQQAPDWRAEAGSIAVIGAGGGSRAVCYGLMQEGATEIRLVNRTHEKALAIAEEFNGPIRVLPWKERHDALEGAAMVVNTTSQGMDGEAALDLKLDKLSPTALAADIIYTPLETPFLSDARERGNPTVNGLGMLIHQGPPAWKRWFDVIPMVTEELREKMERSIAGG
jgi:shikimate dehydrogenase